MTRDGVTAASPPRTVSQIKNGTRGSAGTITGLIAIEGAVSCRGPCGC